MIASLPNPEVYERALDARDPRFDGVFFVGITTTRIYCRPVCPARVSYTNRRRFFPSAAAAEQAGFRPCLRCRPELAPGRAVCDAVPRLASLAAHRISAGALNGRGVTDLAQELGVSERHLRRVLEQEIGVSPLELAQTHRLLLAKQLLADTDLSITRIAFASGFQSLRRFNAAFRERYRMSPTALRRSPRTRRPRKGVSAVPDLVRLTLAYRPPLAWGVLLDGLRREAIPGVEMVEGNRYGRTVCLEDRCGVFFVEPAADAAGETQFDRNTCLTVEVSSSLLPVLMPLLARIRQMFDLDAEPTLVDGWLDNGGLGELVRRTPGLRIPGTLDGFDATFRVLLYDARDSAADARQVAGRITSALGRRIESGLATLGRLTPTASAVAQAGTERLVEHGLPSRSARALVGVAELMQNGQLRLEPGCDIAATRRTLLGVVGMDDTLAARLIIRALSWPDALPSADEDLLRATGETSPSELRLRALRWRPWRTYAALHLWLNSGPA